MYQLQLLTTWGDPYYIGLNGLEFYNEQGVGVALNESSILTSSKYSYSKYSISLRFTIAVPCLSGPAQLSVACSTESYRKLGGAWEQG